MPVVFYKYEWHGCRTGCSLSDLLSASPQPVLEDRFRQLASREDQEVLVLPSDHRLRVRAHRVHHQALAQRRVLQVHRVVGVWNDNATESETTTPQSLKRQRHRVWNDNATESETTPQSLKQQRHKESETATPQGVWNSNATKSLKQQRHKVYVNRVYQRCQGRQHLPPASADRRGQRPPKGSGTGKTVEAA